MAHRMSKRARLIVLIVIGVVLAMVGAALSCSRSGPSESTWPIITWNETTLSTLNGTPVVLNFWSVGCSWCRYQLPFLESVAQQSAGNITVVAINIGESASTVRSFFGAYEPVMMVALDSNGQAFADYCLSYNNTGRSIPFTLFVDSAGVVQYKRIGAFASEEALWNALHDVLGTAIP